MPTSIRKGKSSNSIEILRQNRRIRQHASNTAAWPYTIGGDHEPGKNDKPRCPR